MSEILLKGKVIGFEEYEEYALRNVFDPSSPFRLLVCLQASVAFLVVNPFAVAEDYNIEVDDAVANNLDLTGGDLQKVAVLCIARNADNDSFVNLRSPLIINTEAGRFQQVILQNETYGVSVPFAGAKGVVR